jgi:hypothetical protein
MNKLLLIFVIITVVAMIAGGCRKKNRGGSTDSNPDVSTDPTVTGSTEGPTDTIPVAFTTSQEAAVVTTASLDTKALADAQFAVSMALGLTKPLSGPSGAYAPRHSGANGTDPSMTTMADAMVRFVQAPAIQKALQKAGAMKAARVNTINETATDYCSNADGEVKISGTNNYDDPTSVLLTYSYDVKFTNCRDDIMFTQLDGSIRVEFSEGIDTSVFSSNLASVSLTQLQFSAIDYATQTQKSALNGTFGNSDQATSGARNADGSFIVTTPAKQVSYLYTGVTDTWSSTHNADNSDTKTVYEHGIFRVTTSSAGIEIGHVVMDLNLVERWDTMNDAAGTKKNWLNGVIDINWEPDLSASGCLPGQITITTPDATPRTYTLLTGYSCPVSGSVQFNNSSITYGTSIQVSLTNNTPQIFADCAALSAASGVCAF